MLYSYPICKQEMTENSPLGDLLRGSVDVSSCQIGERPLRFLFEHFTIVQDLLLLQQEAATTFFSIHYF